MTRALTTAASGMISQQTNLDIIANNLANSNTQGFKAERAEFQDLMYQTTTVAGSSTGASTTTPSSIQVGLGSKFAASGSNFSEGSLQNTGNPLDVAIQGEGFFQVTTPDGQTAYTRDGSFKVDSNGLLVTSNGYPVVGDITIPPSATSVTISATGVVSAVLPGNASPQQLGQLQIATFPNPGGLQRIGNNLFNQTSGSGSASTNTPGQNNAGTLQQSFLEGSNVQVVQEMVNMITAQRTYEINSKAITTADQMMQTLNQLKQ